jgi:hypothetical protein
MCVFVGAIDLSYLCRRRAAILEDLALALGPLLPDACERLVTDSAFFLGTPTRAPLSQGGCSAPDQFSPDGDNPGGFGNSYPSSPSTLHVSHAFGDAAMQLGKSLLPAHGAQTLNGCGETCELGGVSLAGGQGASKPRRPEGGKGRRGPVESHLLELNPVTLRFGNQTMEAAYVAAANAKLIMVRKCQWHCVQLGSSKFCIGLCFLLSLLMVVAAKRATGFLSEVERSLTLNVLRVHLLDLCITLLFVAVLPSKS